MPKLDTKTGRGYQRAMAKGLRVLRQQYRTSLKNKQNPQSSPQQELYQEWLRDNYYLLAREGGAALRETKHADLRALRKTLRVCREVCTGVVLPDVELLANALQKVRCNSAESALVPLALRLVFVEAAVRSAGENENPANRVALISGAVTAFRALQDIDFANLLEQISPLEKIFRRDPAGIYPRMDEASRAAYRHLISKQARQQGIPEEALAKDLARKAAGASAGAEKHVGTALLQNACPQRRGRALLWCETLIPSILSLALAFVFRAWYIFPLLLLPFWSLCRILLEAIFLNSVQPAIVPRLELGGEIPEEGRTLIVISTLLPDPSSVQELRRHMDEIHSTNHGKNIAVCVLADLKGADSAEAPQDAAALAAAKKQVEALNEKYGGGFLCAVRRRRYSPTMNAFTGWERKRGALLELAQVIQGKKQADDVFALLCGDLDALRANYMLALDADTQLPLDAVTEMVAAALHPSNKPRVDPAMGRVVRGYGILMPHVDLDLASARSSPFAHAMAGEGGATHYSNQVSERYQDLFGCGIFAGKGLIDIEAFVQVAALRPFPDEQVLSHDILEGGFLRVGFLSDVHVSDGFPGKQSSFFARQERWVRGDWQNLPFLAKKRGLPGLTRYQLFDNLRRSLLAPACLFAILVSLAAPAPVSLLLCLAGVLGMAGGHWASAFRCLCSGGMAMLSRTYYSGGLPAALGDFIRGFLQVITLAQAAYVNLSGALRGLWRTYFSKKNRLSWTTAAQSEAAKGSKWTPWLTLWPSFLAAALMILFGTAGHRLLGIVILSDVLFAHFSAKQRKPESQKLNLADTETVKTYCAAMWNYFETYCTAEHHFLPPDNVQEAPVFRVAPRTSPTNIGLYLLCILAARDLGIIDAGGLELRLGRALESVERLERWHGNLLNWYDTRTLRPLEPRYVSTVDSGNLVVCLRTLHVSLAAYLPEQPSLANSIERLRILEAGCDLKPLYNHRRKLFHIGIDLSDGKASPSYYDLFMSEARMTSYYAIATRMVPKKHWGALGRTLAKQGRFTGPVSWTGTMFEYFMPFLFLPAPQGTLGYEALRFCLYCQKRRVPSQMPWGNSESGFYAFDSDLNYQYKAHGTQKLGLRRGLDEELVLSPYSSFLAMQLAPKTALQNLRKFEKMELTGSCGFYEAADATQLRIGGQDYATVRSYMAHHVGMSLLAALNALQDGIWRRRFMSDEEMAGGRQLLEEKIPDRAAVFRDIDLRDTPRPRERIPTSKQVFINVDPANPKCHLLSNGEWSSVLTDTGASVSFYRGLSIFRYDADALRRTSGVSVILRENKQPPISISPAPYFHANKQKVEFHTASVGYYEEGMPGAGAQISASIHVRVHPRLPAEERRVTLKNTSKQPAKGTVFLYFEPSLTKIREDAEHPAFAKLFLTDEYDKAAGIVTFTRRQRESNETLCLAAGMGAGDDAICERSKERALRRGMRFGEATLEGGKRGNPDACGAFEVSYHLQPGETKEFCLHLCAGVTKEEATARLLHARNENTGRKNPKQGAACPFREGELPAALAQRILPKLLFYTPLSPEQSNARAKLSAPRQALWSLGISGDEPYIYLPVASTGEIPSALPYLSVFRRLRAAGIPCELVIGYNEGGDYDTPMAAALKDALRREHCAHLENRRGGVRLVNLRRAEDNPEALEALQAYAACLCQESGIREQASGDVKPPLPLLATNPLIPAHASLPPGRIAVGAGAFYPGKFVISKANSLAPDSSTLIPAVPWSLPLCNPAFGTLVSDSSLGYTWAINARENKLTPWYNEGSKDNSGELLLLKFGSQLYDLCLGGRCEYTPEEVVWKGEIHGLEYELKVYVPGRGLTKRAELILRNRTTHLLAPELAYFLEPVLGVRREPHLPIQGEALPDGFLFSSPASQIKGFGALLLQGGADFVCADRPAFLRGEWYGSAGIVGSDPCVAVGKRLQIPPGGETAAEFALNWGVKRNAALCAHLVASPETRVSRPAPIKTPDPALNEMLRTWLPHQVLRSRLYSRTGHCQCGGAWGLRDQLQDVSALYRTNPAVAKIQIARCAAAQFPEGDGLHWWHRIPGVKGLRGVRTRYADDYLWLPFIASEYIAATKDTTFLDTQIPFIEGELLRPDEKDRYAVYPQSERRGSLYAHCLLAVERGLSLLGARGLPLMQGGDWNDGMGSVGICGQGESVWLGMFLIMALEGMADLCKIKKEAAPAARFASEANLLRKRIDEHAWAGDHYLRAFWDDGAAMDMIDILPQAFSALCGMPDKNRISQALDTAIKHLADEEHCMIKLLKEPFTHEGRRAGYINDYPPGIRENGGQYTHAAAWLCLALGRIGRKDEAKRLLQMINPAQFCQNPARMERYRAEPYALAGDVSAAPGIEGRAGWTHYTGSAAWFLRCAEELWD